MAAAAASLLDEAALENTRHAFSQTKAEEQQAEVGDAVTLVFKLPDGTTQQRAYTTGTLVACVKLDVERESGIAMAKQTLKVEGRSLIDPLSLADCKGISAGDTVEVTVEAAA